MFSPTDKKWKWYYILGIVLGALCVIILIIFVIAVCCYCCARSSKERSAYDNR